MPFIAFLGCDGSGKSAEIQGVTAAACLEAEGLRSRSNASTSTPATGTGSDFASKLEAPTNPVSISGNRFRKLLEFPFARLAKAGYGYELVAVCKR